jgi:predicted small metal-binding protein
MAKQFACKDIGAMNCSFSTTGKDSNTVVNKVKEHLQKVHKEIKGFDAALEAKVKGAIKEA